MVETTGRIQTLRQILERGDFDLAHQPIVDFRSGSVHHTEALIRFRDGGPPNQWIALAEAADIVTELDLAVCRRAIGLAEAMPQGAPAFAMNLSGRSLENEGFVVELQNLLKNHSQLSSRLMFELTETAVVRDIEAVDRAVQALRQRGFRVCLDDFGAVATSIHYLRSIKVDYVKIDGLFARSCLRNPNDRSILSLRYCAMPRLGSGRNRRDDRNRRASGIIPRARRRFRPGLFLRPACGRRVGYRDFGTDPKLALPRVSR